MLISFVKQAPTVQMLIYQCIYERLFLVCNRTFGSYSSKSINWSIPQIFNSFDPTCSEIKLYVDIPEITIIPCYSGNWVRLLPFFIQIAENKKYSNICANVFSD